MRTFVITGGTSGLGRGLALHYLSQGDRVVVVGSDAGRGAAMEAAGARFAQADLSLAGATLDLARRLREDLPVVDALVLGAFRFQPSRRETAEGVESTFALYVMSRFLLVEELRPVMETAADPVVVNLCGTGLGKGPFDEPARYRGFDAVRRGAHANDLLALAFHADHPESRVRYVLHNPGFVDTGMADALPQPRRALTRLAAKLLARPVARALPPIIGKIDLPDLAEARRLTRTLAG